MIFLAQFVVRFSFGFITIYKTTFSAIEFYVLCLATICIAAGGYIINDICDLKADLINKPKEVYITKSISKNSGYLYYIILTITGILTGIWVAFSIGMTTYSWIFIITASLLFLYSYYLQKIALIGNLLTSILVGFSIYIIYLFETTTIIFSSSFFICIVLLSISLNFLREIIKDIQDINGDYASGYKTLPILLGTKRTLNICTFIALALVFGVSLFTFNYFKDKYIFIAVMLVIIVIPLVIIASKCWNATTTLHFKIISRAIKLLMLIAILLIPLLFYTQYNA